MVEKPSYERCLCCHIPKDKPAARAQHSENTIKKILHVRIMMKTLAADHCIKRVVRKRKVLAVSHDKFYTRHIFCSRHLDHLRSQINPSVVLLWIFILQERDHRRCSASTIQQIREVFFFQFIKDIRIVLFAHFIHACIICFIYFRRF